MAGRRTVVRFVGEPVAAIVAEERYQGADAAELVFVDYEPARRRSSTPRPRPRHETLLFPDAGTNVVFD